MAPGCDQALARWSEVVVNRGQQKLRPQGDGSLAVQLLFYSAHFSAQDALFKTRIGSGINLQHPDGVWESYPFDANGEVTVDKLPRGDYVVTVDAPGRSFARPVSVSRDQVVDLEVLSYLDIALVMGGVTFLAMSLLLIGRPHMIGAVRRRLPGRTWGTALHAGSRRLAGGIQKNRRADRPSTRRPPVGPSPTAAEQRTMGEYAAEPPPSLPEQLAETHIDLLGADGGTIPGQPMSRGLPVRPEGHHHPESETRSLITSEPHSGHRHGPGPIENDTLSCAARLPLIPVCSAMPR